MRSKPTRGCPLACTAPLRFSRCLMAPPSTVQSPDGMYPNPSACQPVSVRPSKSNCHPSLCSASLSTLGVWLDCAAPDRAAAVKQIARIQNVLNRIGMARGLRSGSPQSSRCGATLSSAGRCRAIGTDAHDEPSVRQRIVVDDGVSWLELASERVAVDPQVGPYRHETVRSSDLDYWSGLDAPVQDDRLRTACGPWTGHYGSLGRVVEHVRN